MDTNNLNLLKAEYKKFQEELSKLVKKRKKFLLEYHEKIDEDKINQIRQRLYGGNN